MLCNTRSRAAKKEEEKKEEEGGRVTAATGIELISISYSQDDEEEEEGEEGEGKNDEEDEESPLRQDSDSSNGTYTLHSSRSPKILSVFPVYYYSIISYLLPRGKYLGRLKTGVYN